MTLAALLQPVSAERSRPVVAELCNDTPARVAFAVVRPDAGAGQVQRGWFTVEPGQCLEGAIGNGRAGMAYVHAFSGGYRWPANPPHSPFCTPARTHERAVGGPDCSESERALTYASVHLDTHATHHVLSYRVSCEELDAQDAQMCRAGLLASDGFAEPVRTLEICNMSGSDDRIAVASPDIAGEGWRITEWMDIPVRACADAWRDLAPDRSVYVVSANGSFVGARGESARSFCFAAQADATDSVVEPDASGACTQGGVLTEFGRASFSPRASRFTLVIEP